MFSDVKNAKNMEMLYKAAGAFRIEGEASEVIPFGNGHVNDTYLVTCDSERKYILQRINTEIFKNPELLAENIRKVTSFIAAKTIRSGGDPKREVMRPVPVSENNFIYRDTAGGAWRMFDYIEDSVSLDKPRSLDDFFNCALAFGKFGRLLANYPADELNVVIPDFHDTPKRYAALIEAARKDPVGRASSVFAELAFAESYKNELAVLVEMMRSGELPLRVTHNDTKLNNVLFDKHYGHVLCVVDLDTVMPGLSAYDFGDAIRFGANTADEDEGDVSKVSLDMDLYESYVRGYLDGYCGRLTEKEVEMLPVGAKIMTLECGIRFLTDYISGDKYFKTERKDQNLDRCHSQFALVMDMERKWHKMVNCTSDQAFVTF